MAKPGKIISGFIAVSILLFFSCEKEKFITDSSAKLTFSTDTVFFDTLFTTIGSVTKRFTVKNPHDQKIRISNISLGRGEDSDYRLNINGIQNNQVSDIELAANDSLFIFAEVTIDPNNTNNPMVIKDSVIFETNRNRQDVKLISWGQDMHLIKGEVLQTQTWTADKPYLVYNSALIDTGAVLTIEPGSNIHFHRNSRFYVAGSVQANGTLEEPITFQGDRLEDDYKDIPGQWDGIWLMAGSKNNQFDHVTIKNAIIGVQVDTLENTTAPTLSLSNSQILHMTYAGIYAQGTTIKAHNCVIADCGSYALALTLGGSYEFYHTTIANYWFGSTRSTPSVVLNNYYTDVNDNLVPRDLEQAYFGNCIIYGNKENEIVFDSNPAAQFNYSFNHSLLKRAPLPDTSGNMYNAVLFNQDPKFVNRQAYNFQLDTLSPAINKGDPVIGLNFPSDLNGNSRTMDAAPDLGAFERAPETENP